MPSARPSLPTHFGPFEVIDPLARGGMGLVFRCRHAATGEVVAVKTVAADDPDDLASIRREIHALSQLHHPNIVRVRDHGLSDGFPWYAMELVRGSSLRDHLRARAAAPPTRAEVDAALRILVPVCDALSYLHGHGVVHRDLKPENILVRPDGSPVLVDFGIASAFSADQNREALAALVRSAGTVLYMPPEQVLGQVVDPRADLYSLGCMLFEALTGHPPFQAADVLAIAWRQVNDAPAAPSRLNPEVSDALDALTLRLLAKRPYDRPGYADAVARALALHLGDARAIRHSAPAFLYRPQLFGRGATLARAAERVREARGGQGGLLLIHGESGVGKTRLVVEAAAAATAQSVRVVSGACQGLDARREDDVRAGPLHPLAPLLTVVADLCRAAPECAAALLGPRGRVLAEYDPELGAAADRAGLPPLAALAPRAARDRALDAVRDTVIALAAIDPLLLVLDDLQWADELTLEFLARLADAELSGHRLLVVGTWRSEESSPHLDALASQPTVETLRLTRLDRRAVDQMVRDMLALDEVPATLTSFVYEQSDGNPFFVAEYLRAAAAESLLSRDDEGHWRLRLPADEAREALGDVPQPRAIDALLRRRMVGLSEAASHALRLAGVLGRDFSAELFADTAGLDGEAYVGAVHELCAREIVEEARGARLRFVHDRLREAAYAAVSVEDRPALHRRAAEALERRGCPPAELGALAWHFARAGEHPRAAGYFTAAGDHARGAWAAREAIEHYRSAIDHHAAGEAAGDEVPRLRECIAELHDLLAREDDARAGFERCLTEVPAGRVAWRARLHRKRAKTFETQFRHAEGLRAYDDAMAALGDAPTPDDATVGAPDHPPGAAAWWTEYVQVQIERVWVHYWLAQPAAMQALIERVGPVVEARGAAAQRARFHLAVVHHGLRETRYEVNEAMRAAVARAVAAAEDDGGAGGITYAHFVDGMVAFMDRRLDHAEARLLGVIEDTEQTGDLVLRLRALTYRMVARRLRSDLAETQALAETVLALAQRLAMKDYLGAARACLGWVAWRRGDEAAAARETRLALDLWEALAVKYAYPLTWLARLVDLAQRHAAGAHEAAQAHARALLEPPQQRLPQGLAAALEALRDAPPEAAPTAGAEVVSAARELGYL